MTFRRLMTTITLLMMMVLIGSALAQDSNDPSVNPDANACYDGSFMEYTCNTTDVDGDGVVNQWDIDWMWECGWYLIRVDDAMITEAQVLLDGCVLPERILKLKKPKKIKKEKKPEIPL